jgi:hypothetical protein
MRDLTRNQTRNTTASDVTAFTFMGCDRDKLRMFHTSKWCLIAFEREIQKHAVVWNLIQIIYSA